MNCTRICSVAESRNPSQTVNVGRAEDYQPSIDEKRLVTAGTLWYNLAVRGLLEAYETDLSTESAPKEARSRFYDQNVHKGWTQNTQFEAAERSLETDSLALPRRMR